MNLKIDVIRDSFAVAAGLGTQVADYFYDTLWTQHPESVALFENTNMKMQKELLLKSLSTVVDNLDDPNTLTQYLQAMGSRHFSYGAEDEHFAWVGGALLKTLSHFFGSDWTEELQDQWEMAYDLIATNMKEGMDKARRSQISNEDPDTSTVTTSDETVETQSQSEAVEESAVDEIEGASVSPTPEEEPQTSTVVAKDEVMEDSLDEEEVEIEPEPASNVQEIATEPVSETMETTQNAETHVEAPALASNEPAITESMVKGMIHSGSIELPEETKTLVRNLAKQMVQEAVQREFELAVKEEMESMSAENMISLVKKAA